MSDRLSSKLSESLSIDQKVEDNDGFKTIAATLQLFDLCTQAEDSTVHRPDLAKVLTDHLGGSQQTASVFRHLDSTLPRGKPCSEDQVDFLRYWQAVDRFLNEQGSLARPRDGTVGGMQEFRDGVLRIAIQQESAEETISSSDLLALLGEIRQRAKDPQYWDDVMQAVPSEEGFGLMLPEVAEAVYVWLRDFLKEDMEEGAAQLTIDLEEADDSSTPAMSPELTPFGEEPRQRPRVCSVRRSSAYSSASAFSTNFGSSAPPGEGVSAEVNRCVELADVIGRATGPSSAVVHQALSRMSTAHKALESGVHAYEVEVIELRGKAKSLEKRNEVLQAQYEQLADTHHELERAMHERDQQKKRADALQQQVLEVKELHEVARKELKRINEEEKGHCQELAEAAKREQQWKVRNHELQAAVDKTEGQVKWLHSEIDGLKEQLLAEKEHVLKLKAELARCKAESLARSGCAAEANEGILGTQGEKACIQGDRPHLIEELQSEVRSQSQELCSQKGEIHRLSAEIRDLQDSKRELKNQFVQQCATLEERDQRLMEVTQALQDAEQRLQVAHAQKEEALKLRRSGVLQSQDAAATAARASSELAELKRAAAEQESQLAEARQKLQQREDKIQRLSASAEERQAHTARDTKLLEDQLRAQQAEINQLRDARDELVAAGASGVNGSPNEDDEGDFNLEQLNVYRKNSLLQRMVRDLLRHTKELERAIDDTRGAGVSNGPESVSPLNAAESRRRLSIQRITEEWTSVFNEKNDELHTIEVQKEDADREVGRLSELVARQEKEISRLKEVETHRDSLLLELCSLRSVGDSRASTAFGGGDHCDPSATSDASSTVGEGGASAAKSGGSIFSAGSQRSADLFLGEGAGPSLQLSPKKPKDRRSHVDARLGGATAAAAPRSERMRLTVAQGPVGGSATPPRFQAHGSDTGGGLPPRKQDGSKTTLHIPGIDLQKNRSAKKKEEDVDRGKEDAGLIAGGWAMVGNMYQSYQDSAAEAPEVVKTKSRRRRKDFAQSDSSHSDEEDSDSDEDDGNKTRSKSGTKPKDRKEKKDGRDKDIKDRKEHKDNRHSRDRDRDRDPERDKDRDRDKDKSRDKTSKKKADAAKDGKPRPSAQPKSTFAGLF